MADLRRVRREEVEEERVEEREIRRCFDFVRTRGG